MPQNPPGFVSTGRCCSVRSHLLKPADEEKVSTSQASSMRPFQVRLYEDLPSQMRPFQKPWPTSSMGSYRLGVQPRHILKPEGQELEPQISRSLPPSASGCRSRHVHRPSAGPAGRINIVGALLVGMPSQNLPPTGTLPVAAEVGTSEVIAGGLNISRPRPAELPDAGGALLQSTATDTWCTVFPCRWRHI